MKQENIKIVLDTNIFVNPDSRKIFGNSPLEAFNGFLALLEKNQSIRCFMPPTVFTELSKFIEIEQIPLHHRLIEKKPPAKYELTLPSLFLYEFIEDMRNRVNKGLRIAEKHLKNVANNFPLEESIRRVREEYRIALREGTLDSKEDTDLILLAKELSAYLATTDNGLITWAHKLGIACIDSKKLKSFLC